jgi:hypothetical protein
VSYECAGYYPGGRNGLVVSVNSTTGSGSANIICENGVARLLSGATCVEQPKDCSKGKDDLLIVSWLQFLTFSSRHNFVGKYASMWGQLFRALVMAMCRMLKPCCLVRLSDELHTGASLVVDTFFRELARALETII